jgi:hypothetical protein
VTVTPSITVTAPAAGAYWGAGSTHAITWRAPQVPGNVEVRLYTYPAGTFVTLITGIPASQGFWNWTIPSGQAYGTQYRIRVVGKSLTAFSDAYLQIGVNDTTPPMVTVNQAAGQIDPAPVPSSAVPIQFTVQFSEPVIGFTLGDLSWTGSTATGIMASLSGSGSTYTLKVTASSTGTLVPSIPAGMCMDAAHNPNAASTGADTCVTVSNAPPGPITVTAPAAGTYWGAGSTQTITWTAPLLTENVNICLYNYATGGSSVTLASGVAAGRGSWDWAIPPSQAYGTKYRIRVVGKSLSAFSGAYLQIGVNDTTKPMVTVNQASGQIDPAPVPSSAVPVQFTVQFSEPVTGFTLGDVSWTGSTATGITASLSGSGSAYTIKVTASSTGTLLPSIPAGACIDSAYNPNTASTGTTPSVTASNAPPGPITVAAPAAGVSWAAGSTRTITWIAPLVTGNVEIRLYTYPAGSYVTLVTGIPAAQGSWNWAIPSNQALGTRYRIRVVANSLTALSGAYFAIN